MTADQIIKQLNLAPHPEGGYYRQTWQADHEPGERAVGTAIYYLLPEGERSHWHRVDAVEIWHFYAGAPLTLHMAESAEGPKSTHILGPDLARGALPQLIVPEGHWQAAQATDGWTLVGCTVSPGFQFDGFEMAPPGFEIA